MHFTQDCADPNFTAAWGRTWAERRGGSFDPLTDANHVLQDTHGPEIVNRILARTNATG